VHALPTLLDNWEDIDEARPADTTESILEEAPLDRSGRLIGRRRRPFGRVRRGLLVRIGRCGHVTNAYVAAELERQLGVPAELLHRTRLDQ